MDDTNWKVYCHIVKKEISGYDYDKYYIGITSKERIEDRFWRGNGYNDQPFFNAINKYGWENIEHKILFENLERNVACDIEKSLIKSLNCKLGFKGYNGTDGGEGVKGRKMKSAKCVYCLELKRAFRNCQVAEDIMKKDYSIDNRGIRNCCKYNNSSKIIHHTSHNMTWVYVSDMYKINNVKKSKPVYCEELNTIYANAYSSNYSTNGIYSSCKNNEKSCGRHPITNQKLHWMYLEDYLFLNDYTEKCDIL